MAPRLSNLRIALLLTAPLALVGLAWGLPRAFAPSILYKPPATSAVCEPDGGKLYFLHCAYCHGPTGDSRGSVLLHPPARYFGRDRFKFGTTANDIPTDDDLLKVLDRGIPGSAMPSFAHLSGDEKCAILQHIRTLTRKGLYDRKVEEVLKDTSGDREMEPAKFASFAAEAAVPGAKLDVPRFPPSTPEAAARGKLVYAKLCASCHGPDGKGDGGQVAEMIRIFETTKKDPANPENKKFFDMLAKGNWLHPDGSLNTPRDLTAGQFKGGTDPADLYARIMLGIPGTPMPASNSQPREDIMDLVHFLRTLSRR